MGPGGGQGVLSIMTGTIGLWRRSAKLSSLQQESETAALGVRQQSTTLAALRPR